jgi:ATP-dependent Clp protease protease subunit
MLSVLIASSALLVPPSSSRPQLLRVVAAQMASGAAGLQQVDGVRIGPPPDLPSLLLNNRIVYVGLPLVPSVTELVVAQLLYLNYETKEKPVFM